jgi:ABC-2 type transport system ATP-binding protein
MTEAISVANVDKTYKGGVHALRGVDLLVHRGEVFGLLGPNGAGKSTLIKILMTVIRATRCTGHMLGRAVGHKPTLARVGYLPEHHAFPGYLTGAQVLDFYAAMTGMKRADRKRRIPELLELVNMNEWGDARVRSYSKGMRQRVGIAQALMHDPELVLLDEPTDGVDPVGRRDIRDVVLRLKDEGRAVFLNSHLLSELEMVTDRVAILVQGQVALQGTIDELTRDKRRYEIDVVPDGVHAAAVDESDRDASRFSRHLAELLPVAAEQADLTPIDGEARQRDPSTHAVVKRVGYAGQLATGERVRIDRGRINVWTEDPERIEPLIDALRGNGVTLRSVRPVRPSLEELFIEAVTNLRTGETLKPGAAEHERRKRRKRGAKAADHAAHDTNESATDAYAAPDNEGNAS